MPTSYAPEVIADDSGKWCGNSMRFRTEEEAETWVMDLSMRWILVRETRVVPSDDPPNYEIVKGDDGRFVCRFLTSPPPDSPSPEAA